MPEVLTPRIISADFATVQGPRSQTFRTCVGAGRVGEGMRADWQRQLQICRDAIGFEYLRCHGLLHDELGVYREDKDGHAVYNWQYIDTVYDFLLSIGVRPFVEIGFTPNDLATIRTEEGDTDGLRDGRRVSVFWWKGNVTPPTSWEKWDALIAALTQHWTDRYGSDEVRQWYFEIWNEPNHHAFFSPHDEATRMEEYFELYAHTVRAIKSVDSAYRVGGTSSAGPAWVGELIAYGAENDVPTDFISYHCYGLKGKSGGLDEFGQGLTFLNPNLRSTAEGCNSQRAVIDRSARPGLPIFITEWSASYSARDPVHDTYFEAAYILEQLKHTQALGAMSYWTFTDIFEEGGPTPRPFHGGFGLITVQDIKKPAFYAYQFLHQLGDTELVNTDERSWVCRNENGGAQVLFWDITSPLEGDDKPNQTVFRKLMPPQPQAPVLLTLTGMTPGRYMLTVTRTGFEQNDAYTAYLNMGAPVHLDRAQVTALQSVSSGKPAEEREIEIGADGRWSAEYVLRGNDVVLTQLTPIALA